MINFQSLKRKRYYVVLLIVVVFAACSKEGGSKQELAQSNSDMSPGVKLLKDYCSHCHGPPLSTSHPAQEWRNVVLRMQKHRIVTGLNPIPGEQLELIIAYLAEQAADVKE